MVFDSLFVIILLGAFYKTSVKSKKLHVILCTSAFILIAGLRHYTVGVDTQTYVTGFKIASEKSFSQILEHKEALYYIFQTSIAKFSNNYTVFLSAIAVFFYSILGFLIYRYSKNVVLSFMIFVCMGYFFFSMTGLRQTMGLGMLLIATNFVLCQQYKIGILFVILAGLFHITSFIYFIIYPSLLIKPKHLKKYMAIIFLFSILFTQFASSLLPIVSAWFWDDDRYSVIEEKGGLSTLVMLILIAIFLYQMLIKRIMIKSNLNIDDKINFILYKIYLLGIPFQVATLYSPNIFRLSLLFHITSIVIIPNAIATIRSNYYRQLVSVMFVFILLFEFYLFTSKGSGIQPYSFFWEKS